MFSDYTPSENEYNPHSDVALGEQSRDELPGGDGYKQQTQAEVMAGKYKQQVSLECDENMTNTQRERLDKQELKQQIDSTTVQSKL